MTALEFCIVPLLLMLMWWTWQVLFDKNDLINKTVIHPLSEEHRQRQRQRCLNLAGNVTQENTGALDPVSTKVLFPS